MLKLIKLLLFISIVTLDCNAQDQGFQFHRDNKRSYKVNFVNFNNLIIMEVKLNGQPMNFLIDTGVDKTVVFGLKEKENILKQTSKKILIKGVSGQHKTFAYKVENNTLSIDKFKDQSHDVYVIFDDKFNVSDKIGYPVQGILGYDFFKNHVFKINYSKAFIKIYNPKYFNKKLRSYSKLKLRIHKGKPYVKALINVLDEWHEFIFLIDTGSGDAIWLKPNANTEIPNKNFEDILGYGFADVIEGIRSKAHSFKIGDIKLEKPKIAYPDTTSYKGVNFTDKSGVLGSEVLKRFHWILDYKNGAVYLKPNRFFEDIFNYDMSGLLLKYDGFQARTYFQNIFPQTNTNKRSSNATQRIETKAKVFVQLEPILKIGAIRPNSSAFEAGFIEGDIITKIQGRRSDRYDLEEITKLLSSEEGKEIKFEIKRGGRIYEKSLILKSRFLE
ncbi:retropepsin-like aspartic protease [Mesohalobacter halotolerans]|nr:aspartyl protease family protein [Mesohalobacter halotolerans]MBS3738757.1 aspartyl protease family protein [Psychroflexus sp.]